MTGRVVGKITEAEYLTRNSTPGGFFADSWDGKTYKGSVGSPLSDVPNGQYVVTLWLLKALGNQWTSSHWESWTSPVITIARP